MGADVPTPTNIVPEFGPRLRAAREAAGIGQRELARRVGIAQSLLARLEAGTRAPYLAVADQLAAALGLLVSDLLPPRRRARQKGKT